MSFQYRSPLSHNEPSTSGYVSSRPHPYRRDTLRTDHRSSSTGEGHNNGIQPPDPQPKYSDRYKLQGLPPELNRLIGPLNCQLCAVESTSSITAKMHYSGKQHAKKVKNFLEVYCKNNGLPMPELDTLTQSHTDVKSFADYCEYCEITLISENDKIMHYAGKQHRKNERHPENAKRKKKSFETIDLSGRFGIGRDFIADVEKEEKPIILKHFCQICDLKFSSADELKIHSAGKKHKIKLEKAKSSDIPTKEKRFVCEICAVKLETEALYNLHLKGKRHSKALQKLEIQGNDICETCNVHFTSYQHYESHMKGKKHEKMCMKISNFMKESTPASTIKSDAPVPIACELCPYVGNLDNHECDRSLLIKINREENIENKWACYSCTMFFENEDDLNAHKKSSRHILISLNKTGDQVVEELRYWYCILCKKQYKNHQEFTQHLFEETHLTASSNQEPLIEVKANLYHCHFCDLILDKNILDEHEKDRKHIEKCLRKEVMESITKLVDADIYNYSFVCSNCNVALYGFIKYKEHLLSDVHIDKLIDSILNNSV